MSLIEVKSKPLRTVGKKQLVKRPTVEEVDVVVRPMRTMTVANQKVVRQRPSAKPAKQGIKKAEKKVAKKLGIDRSKTLSDKEKLLLSFTLPKTSEPQQLSSLFGAAPTGAVNPFAIESVQFSESTEAEILPFALFMFRSALRANVEMVWIRAGQTGTYAATAYTFSGNAQTRQNCVLGPLLYVNGVSLHGSRLWPGRIGPEDPRRGYWMNTNSVMNVAANAIPITCVVNMYRQQGREWRPYLSQSVGTGGNINFTALEPGYYAFEIVPTTATFQTHNFTFQLTIVAGPNGILDFGHHSLPDFETKIAAIEAVRVLGVAAMFTNTTAEINKQGQVVGCQMSDDVEWISLGVGLDLYGNVANLRKSVPFKAKDGIYGFLKPASYEDLEYLKEFTLRENFSGQQYQAAGFLTDGAFNFFGGDYLVIAGTMDTSVEDRSSVWSKMYWCEFQSNSQWDRLTVAKMNYKVIDGALSDLRLLQQWYPNDLHFEDIWKGITMVAGDLWSGAKQVAPYVAPVLGLL